MQKNYDSLKIKVHGKGTWGKGKKRNFIKFHIKSETELVYTREVRKKSVFKFYFGSQPEHLLMIAL